MGGRRRAKGTEGKLGEGEGANRPFSSKACDAVRLTSLPYKGLTGSGVLRRGLSFGEEVVFQDVAWWSEPTGEIERGDLPF